MPFHLVPYYILVLRRNVIITVFQTPGFDTTKNFIGFGTFDGILCDDIIHENLEAITQTNSLVCAGMRLLVT